MYEQRVDWDLVISSWHERPQRLWRRHSDAVNGEFLVRCLPRGRCLRLLKTDMFDEAVSEGLYPLLARSAHRVVGVDVAEQVLRAARSRYAEVTLAQTDTRRLAFAGNSIEVVVSLSTLDHFGSFDETVIALREIRRVLRPGGHLLVTLDNLTNPIVALRSVLPIRLLNRLGLVPYFVGPTCGAHHLGRLLTQMGFDPIELTAILHCPRVLAVAAAAVLDRVASTRTRAAFLRCLQAMERLGGLPTRYVTGHLIAAHAIKR